MYLLELCSITLLFLTCFLLSLLTPPPHVHTSCTYMHIIHTQVGPAASILGIVAYFFIFLLFESRFLVKPWLEFLKLVGVVVVLFLLGLLPFIDNLAHIGGFVFGLFTSGIIIPYGPYRKLQEHNTIPSAGENKKDVFLIIKIVLVLVGIPVVLALFVLFFLLFYLVQDTWEGFGYLSCIPFTSTICNDVRPILRSRGEFFV